MKTQTILITLSVIANAPTDENAVTPFLNKICDEIGVNMAVVAKNEAAISLTNYYVFHYLDDPDVNARPCKSCRDWTTDIERANPIISLKEGMHTNRKFLCEVCRIEQYPSNLSGR